MPLINGPLLNEYVVFHTSLLEPCFYGHPYNQAFAQVLDYFHGTDSQRGNYWIKAITFKAFDKYSRSASDTLWNSELL